MRFTKLQSAGNDFVLVEAANVNCDWMQLARDICQRRFGVGADGLLLLMPSRVADFGMRVFNADGSEAEACGNGLRCLVKYTIDRGLTATGAGEITVETIAGVRKARLFTEAGKTTKIQVGMGKPEFEANKIPVAIEKGKENLVDIKLKANYPITVEGRELQLCFVSIGNPHAIYFVNQQVSDFPLSQIGPLVEQHELFPKKVNFEVANVISRKQIDVRVWERGVGETLAQLLCYVDSKAEIDLLGGMLEVEWDRVGEVLLSGTAETVFSGEWPD
jgi:diaminopimelate epimerase